MGRRGRELSLDIKKLFVDLYENGHKLSEISKLLPVPYMTISNIVKKYRTLVQLKTRREAVDLNLCQTEITENLNI